MKTAKEDVRQLLEDLPDSATYEDIQYHIYVTQKIRKGLASAEKGEVVSHEEVMRRFC